LDTKWKNRGSLVLIVLVFTFVISGLVAILINGNAYMKPSYFHTGNFDQELYEFVEDLKIFELNPVTEKEMIDRLTVTEDEINQYRINYGDIAVQIDSIMNDYVHKIENAGNEEAAQFYIKERDSKVEDLKNVLENDEYVKNKILEEKQQLVKNHFKELDNRKWRFRQSQSAFSYVIKNSTTGEVLSNMDNPPEKAIKKGKNVVFVRNYPSIQLENQTLYSDYSELSVDFLGSNDVFEGQVAVIKSGESNYILDNYQHFRGRQIIFFLHILLTIAAVIFLYRFYQKKKEIVKVFFDTCRPYYFKLPLMLKLTLLVVTFIVTMALMDGYVYWQDHYNWYDELIRLVKFMWVTPFVGFLALQFKLLFDLLKDGESLEYDWKRTWLYRSCVTIKSAFLNRRIGTQLFALLFLIFFFGLWFGLMFVEEAFMILTFLFFVMAVPFLIVIVKQAGNFNKIFLFTKKLEEGVYEEDLQIKGKSVLAKHAETLNILKANLKTSQSEQVKSERLKAELITNVSHDLRTPLTSIITYTELLKNQELNEEDRASYVKIIDRKSKRLKVLIDDLFEVSKMTSGTIELVKTKVDIAQLLDQALAEHNEAIEQSSLEFRVVKTEAPIFLTVDGQKIWRVFDNLIGNILKYSLENSRVYITAEQIEGKAVLTFKNVSKYELGGNTDEMLERFKRGDTSRHTDGSGLGLAIAKSIIDLHNGNLEIEVDGDLFKVKVTIG
jgi:signal transduction histidine kinase